MPDWRDNKWWEHPEEYDPTSEERARNVRNTRKRVISTLLSKIIAEEKERRKYKRMVDHYGGLPEFNGDGDTIMYPPELVVKYGIATGTEEDMEVEDDEEY